MVRDVRYDGFAGRPELRLLAERGAAVLADETADWGGELTAGWRFDPVRPDGLTLHLRLDLPAASGEGSRHIPLAVFADEAELRSQIRRTWDAASSAYLAKRRPVWDELARQPIGV